MGGHQGPGSREGADYKEEQRNPGTRDLACVIIVVVVHNGTHLPKFTEVET